MHVLLSRARFQTDAIDAWVYRVRHGREDPWETYRRCTKRQIAIDELLLVPSKRTAKPDRRLHHEIGLHSLSQPDRLVSACKS